MQKYNTNNLRQAANKILNGDFDHTLTGEKKCSFHRLFDIAFFSLFSNQQTSESVNIYLGTYCVLSFALQDFCNDHIYAEYNSIKHAHRAYTERDFVFRFASMDKNDYERPDDSKFHNLLKSDLALSFYRICKIKINNKIQEVGLELFTSTICISSTIERIELFCEAIDILLAAIKLDTDITIDMTLRSPNKQLIQAVYGTSPNEGYIIKKYTYSLEEKPFQRNWAYEFSLFMDREINTQPFSLNIINGNFLPEQWFSNQE